jgi:hypothetical membrane protein
MGATKQAAGLAVVALVAVASFAVTVVLLHPLRPDYDPARRFISEFAIGPYHTLMTAAFFALATGSFALTLALWRAGARSRPGITLLGIWSAGVVIVGIFPTDLQFTGRPKTLAGTIHDDTTLVAFVSIMTAMLVLSYHMRRLWPSWCRAAMALAVASLVEFGVLFVSVGAGWPGWPQRLYVATIVAWLLLTAARVRSAAAGVATVGECAMAIG